MLADEGRREKGVRAKRYVTEVHALDKVVDAHIEVYEGLLNSEWDSGREGPDSAPYLRGMVRLGEPGGRRDPHRD